MKKAKKIGLVIVLVLIIVVMVGLFVTKKIEQEKEYEIEQVNQYKYFVLKQNDAYGVINREGKKVIESEYDEVKIPNPEKSIFICYKNDEIKVFNEEKQEILTEYEKVEPIRLKNIISDLMYEKNVLVYLENGKYGLINFQGKKITQPIYEEISALQYKEGELLVKKDNKYGVINIKGKEKIKIAYDEIEADGYYSETDKYKNSGYIVKLKTDEGYRYGYIDNKGKSVLKEEYNNMSRIIEISDDKNVYVLAAKNGQYGVLKNGKNILKYDYQSIRYDNENNIFVVEKSKKFGVVDLTGKIVVPVEYNQIDIVGIYLYAKNEQGTVVYSANGAQAKINTNIAILNTKNVKYRIRINTENNQTKYGVIGKEGQQIIEEKYNYLEYLYDDYFIVSNENSKLGVINNRGNECIELKYDSIQKVQDTKLIQAYMTSEKILQVFDEKMNLVCEMKEASIGSEKEYIKISNNKEVKYFSKDGLEVSNMDVFNENNIFAKFENDKWGFVDKEGNKIIECQYENVTEINSYGFAGIKKDGKWGVINDKGQIIVEPIYDLKNEQNPTFIDKYYQVKYGFGEIYFTDK